MSLPFCHSGKVAHTKQHTASMTRHSVSLSHLGIHLVGTQPQWYRTLQLYRHTASLVQGTTALQAHSLTGTGLFSTQSQIHTHCNWKHYNHCLNTFVYIIWNISKQSADTTKQGKFTLLLRISWSELFQYTHINTLGQLCSHNHSHTCMLGYLHTTGNGSIN